ncbi:hypothetical protein MM560_G219n33 [Manis javanica]|nr:hypothetical protein MM560_G219n33 [Manis javanica]
MVMVLKEIQPTDTLPPVSTSGMASSASAPPITQPHSQGRTRWGSRCGRSVDPARALSGGESGAAGGALSADRASLPATSGLQRTKVGDQMLCSL